MTPLLLDWPLFDVAIESLAQRLRELEPFDYTIALDRGGVIPAYLLHRQLPKVCRNRVVIHPAEILRLPDEVFHSPRLLIVDDIWDSGDTMRRMAEFFPTATLATAVSKTLDTLPNHIHGAVIDSPQWIIFPWEVRDENS